jgi:hypothetical protein
MVYGMSNTIILNVGNRTIGSIGFLESSNIKCPYSCVVYFLCECFVVVGGRGITSSKVCPRSAWLNKVVQQKNND